MVLIETKKVSGKDITIYKVKVNKNNLKEVMEHIDANYRNATINIEVRK
jgi:hypothetical protein